mgnify:FL=1
MKLNGPVNTFIEYLYRNGVLDGKIVHTFDVMGNAIEAKGYNSKGLLLFRTVVIFDQYGNKTEERRYDSAGILTHQKVIGEYTYYVGMDKK